MKKSENCPPPGTKLALKKVMSPSFIQGYEGCDVVVEAEFYKTGNEGYMLGGYDTAANTTFQVVTPGETPQASLGGTFGTFAGTPKDKSDVLFDLKPGDRLELRGAPVGYYSGGNLVVGTFHATTVSKLP